MFAKAQGILAKTDQLDARVLAQYAAVMAPPVRAAEPQMLEELREFVVARASAVEQQTALKNQRSTATVKFLQHQLDRRIERGDQDIAALDAAILKHIKVDDGLARRYAILTSIAGIGFVIAATLLASLPELGQSTVKQIAMLAGLAPIADQSGKRDGVRVVWGGRANVRRILYLAALAATALQYRHESFLPTHDRRRKTTKTCPHRRRQKACCPRQYPHQPRSNLAAPEPQNMLDFQHRCSPRPSPRVRGEGAAHRPVLCRAMASAQTLVRSSSNTSAGSSGVVIHTPCASSLSSCDAAQPA